MLKLKKNLVEKINNISQLKELHTYLQHAIELEHATIPVYLTGLFSIKQDTNEQARKVMLSVVIEEMLHMSIACNVLNAIGGSPAINQPKFVPTFPGPLPMDVGEDRGLQASLNPLTKDQVLNVFMAIEEPEHPLFKPQGLAPAGPPDGDEYSTIGEFYAAIVSKIKELNGTISGGIFTGDQSKQLVNAQWFPPTELFPITDETSADAGIQLIVEQGEGSESSPLDPEKQPAHYYRFAEIYYGHKLIADPSVECGWSFTGEPVPLDEDNIYNLLPNAKASDYKKGTRARRYADQTNYTYSSLLNALHQTFNGDPAYIDKAMGLMYELRLTVQKMVTINLTQDMMNKELDGDYVAAPPFEYVNTNI